MKADAKILDDIARVAGGAVNIASGIQQQIREDIKSRIDDMAHRMDLVPREDFDRAMAMINALEQRIAVLEESGKTSKAKTTKTTKKTKEAKK